MIFLATWGCASDFLKMLPKFKMAARGQLQNFLWAQKLKKLVWSIFFNFNITLLATWGCASDFLKIIPKYKMVARGQR